MFLTILVSLLIFGVLIMSHEFGHFITAVKCGVKVEEFSIGMGPLLFRKVTKTTQYSLRLFPFGGYCKMKGEDGENYEEGSFNRISPLRKILILASGSLMNLIIAVLLFFIVYNIVGTVPTNVIGSFTDVSPAQSAGITVGDTIKSIDGKKIKTWDDITLNVKGGTGQTIQIVVQKTDGSEATYNITPAYDEEQQSYIIGIYPKMKANLWNSFVGAFETIWLYIKMILSLFINIFKGQAGLDAFSGPIGATAIIGEFLPQGIVYIINIAAAISVSLGLLNLFPIPALDGSRIVFVIIEMIKGSPVNKNMEGTIHFVGLMALIGFAILIAYRDVIRFF